MKLTVKVSFQVRNKISRPIIGAELKDKHREKNILLNKIKKRQEKLKSRVGYGTFVVFCHNINKVISQKRKDWMKTHHKKIEGLKRTQNKINNIRNRPTEHIIHNFLSYVLSKEEKRALMRFSFDEIIPSFSLDEMTPTGLIENKLQTEFESFYWQLFQHQKYLSQREQDQLNRKIRRTCEKYIRIKTPYKYKKIIKNLSNNNNVIILKQDKGRCVVLLNRKCCIEKCCKILETGKFRKFGTDPTKPMKGKLQQLLRGIKNVFTEREYERLYPTGSKPSAFYGNAKVHKLRKGKGLRKIALRTFVSNVGTATYNTAKY